MPLQPVMTFARAEPRLSANGRDFVHIMPIQTSLNGHRVTYLWLGTSSTIDRGVSHGEPTASFGMSDSPISVKLSVVNKRENTLVNLPLVAWRSGQLLAELIERRCQTSQRTALPRRDLRQLISANPSALMLVDASGEEKSYDHVQGSWR